MAGLLFFIVCWLISPLILIPWLIKTRSQKTRMEQFLQRLWFEKRISTHERETLETDRRDIIRGVLREEEKHKNAGVYADAYKNLESAYKPVSSTIEQTVVQNLQAQRPEAVQPDTATAENAQTVAQNVSQKAEPAAVQSVTPQPNIDKTAQPTASQYLGQSIDTPYSPQYKPPREHKQYSFATVLFGIGITFVLLAGVVFSVAYWVSLTDPARVGVIALAAIFFFGVSAFSKRKLGLTGSSAALYMLGSVFSTITMITAGYFKVFGEFFSLDGRGAWLFLSFCTLTVTACAFGAQKIYKHSACRYITTYSVFISATMLLAQVSRLFNRPYQAFVLLSAVFGTCATIALIKAKNEGRELSKPTLTAIYGLRAIYAALALPLVLSSFNYTIDGTSVLNQPYIWCTIAIYTAELLWHAIRKYSNKWLVFHGIGLGLIFTELLLSATMHRPSLYPEFTLFVTLFAAIMQGVYSYLSHSGSLRFEAGGYNIAMRVFFALLTAPLLCRDYGHFGAIHYAVCLIPAAELLIYAILNKSELWLGGHAFLTVFTVGSLGLRLGEDNYSKFALCITLAGAIGSGVYVYLKDNNRLRFDPKLVNIFTRAALMLMALPAVEVFSGKQNYYQWAISLIFVAETLFYAIYRKNSIVLLIHNIFLLIPVFELYHYFKSVYVYELSVALGVAFLTAVYFALYKLKKIRLNAKVPIIVSRLIYAALVLPAVSRYILNYGKEPITLKAMTVPYGLIICAILCAELTVYGLALKSTFLKTVQAFFVTLTFGCGCICLDVMSKTVDNHTAAFIFTTAVGAYGLLCWFNRGLYSGLGDLWLMLVELVFAFILLDAAPLPYGLIAALLGETLLFLHAFDDKHLLRVPAGLILPLPLIIMISDLSWYAYTDMGLRYAVNIGFIICATVLTLVALVYTLGVDEARKYRMMKYSFEVFAALALYSAISAEGTALGFAISALVGVLLYAVIHLSHKNYHAFLPMFLIFGGVYRAIYEELGTNSDLALLIASVALCVILALTSRLMFPKSLVKRGENGLSHLDTAQFCLLMCPFIACFETDGLRPRVLSFIILLEFAAFFANFYRRDLSKNVNRLAISAGALFVGIALAMRPFMVFESSMVTMKITLLIIVAFGLAVKFIWREDKKISLEFSQTVFMAAYLLLLFDALINQTVLNSLIVLGVSLGVLLFSFAIKSKRWFMVSAVGLAGLTLYITRDFLTSVAWWVYLLFVGILLIVIASVNEYRKNKSGGEGRFFESWKW